jgi:drug/metabolite transporter (DMT)-like permease
MNKHIAAIIFGSIALGSIGILVRLADSTLPPMTQTFARIFFSFFFISLYNFATNKDRLDVFKVPQKHLFLFFLNGFVGFTVMASAFTFAVLHTSITNTYFLLYTAPVFATLFGAIFLKDKIGTKHIVSLTLAIIGLLFLFNPSNIFSQLTGNMFGLLTGISFGAYFVITGFLRKQYDAKTVTLWTQLFGSLSLLPLLFIFGEISEISLSLQNLWPTIASGGIIFVGYLLLNIGLGRVKSSTGSLLSLFEPLSSVVFGFIFFAEIITTSTVVGIVFILLAVIYLTLISDNNST